MNITMRFRAQIRAMSYVGLCLSTVVVASAQVAASNSGASDRDAADAAGHSQVVQMSAFEVRTTEGNGYL